LSENRSFVIDGKEFGAYFSQVDQTFAGYKHKQSGRTTDIYTNPDVTLVTSGASPYGPALSSQIGATYKGTGPEIIFKAEAIGLGNDIGIIQTSTNTDPNIDLYPLRFAGHWPNTNIHKSTNENGNFVNRFVDAGKYSPAGDLGTGIYYGMERPFELGPGFTYFYDAPSAVTLIKKITFETIIVAKDYYGHKVLLGSFKWGYDDNGSTPLDAAVGGINKLGPVSQEARDIIKKDYPNEKFIH
jgi:hypothetical protein